jgi:hypothetical protein
MTQLAYSGVLTISTCWCGMRHAVPAELHDFQERQHRDGRKQIDIYCPLGHTYIISGQGEAGKLRRQLNATRSLLEQEERSHRAARGAATRARNERDRLKKRASAGVCPCCHRTFKQLAAHMQNKHPDYPDQPEEAT